MASNSKSRICVICGEEFTAPNSYYVRHTCSDRCRRLLMQRNRWTDQGDISGKRFGRLIAICETDVKRSNSVAWLCKCDCGNTVLAAARSLRTGTTKSCGCWRRDNARITAAGNIIDVAHTHVTKVASKGLYYACRILDGRQYHIGAFETREAAEEVRKIAQQIPDDEFLDWLSDLRERRKREKALHKKKGK